MKRRIVHILIVWLVLAAWVAPFVIGWAIGGEAGARLVGTAYFAVILFVAFTALGVAIVEDYQR